MPRKDSIARFLTVGQLAKRSGVAVSALHFYEAHGLIRSIRTSSNHRRYARDMLRRVAVIKTAQRVGLSLDGIRRAFASLPEERTPTAADWRLLSARWKEELDARIAELTRLRDDLSGCIGCGCLSIRACRLRNPDDALSRSGVGAQLLGNAKVRR